MKGLHHVGITVKDLDASIRFYHDVLGLEFSNEPSPWFEGEELEPRRRSPRRRPAPGEPAARGHDPRAPRVQEPAERDRRAAQVEQPRRLARRLPRRRHRGEEGRARGEGHRVLRPRSTSSTRVCWPAGAGCTSRIRTAIRSSSWRSRTTTRRSGAPESRRISRRGRSAAGGSWALPPSERPRPAHIDLRPCAESEKMGVIPSHGCLGNERVTLTTSVACTSTLNREGHPAKTGGREEPKADRQTATPPSTGRWTSKRPSTGRVFATTWVSVFAKPASRRSIGLRELARRLGVSAELDLADRDGQDGAVDQHPLRDRQRARALGQRDRVRLETGCWSAVGRPLPSGSQR